MIKIVCDDCKSENVVRVNGDLYQCKDCKTVFNCKLPLNLWGVGDPKIGSPMGKDPIVPRPITEKWR